MNEDTHVFYRNPFTTYPVIARGEGAYLFDTKGKRYLDACGGAVVSALGHNVPEVVEALKAQLDSVEFAHTSQFTNPPQEQLAELLAELSPGGLNHAYFVSGGSEAVESAIKMARAYWVQMGRPEKWMVIGREQSYHGNTLGALAAGGNRWRRALYEPMLYQRPRVSPCYCYRCPFDKDPAHCALECADDLERAILEVGPEKVSAFIAEPIVGATAGALVPHENYFRRIREICDRYDVLLIADEVMTGLGRCGTWFAIKQFGVVPDMICMAKGLAAGYVPIGATLVHNHIVDTFHNRRNVFQHGHTYMGHPLAAAAGVAVIKYMQQHKLVERSKKMGEELITRLREALHDHPHVGDIRGRGLFCGIEFVLDRATKHPFEPELAFHRILGETAFANGLIIYPMGGTLDGRRGDHVLIAPPFIITKAQIGRLVELLVKSIDATVAKLRERIAAAALP
ncbi:aspartate aminotransferase family protein [Pseudothauera lacus]|uniref:Aspartate aminotransferase family protein n=1 Tax=Pseudothauera lacus TaxID=2136175 RepID=A0A2T4IG45_9RHOO|nr:aspartate aminotransferase family protein [Pseudothauera lacus]PTD96727.1 aspartate aminotransferase family protein [Pseudothauera lacus]